MEGDDRWNVEESTIMSCSTTSPQEGGGSWSASDRVDDDDSGRPNDRHLVVDDEYFRWRVMTVESSVVDDEHVDPQNGRHSYAMNQCAM